MTDELFPLYGGRETRQGPKLGSEKEPLITIITSTYNAAASLHWTIDSIRTQKYQNIQWIVADGGSKDGTVDILMQNEDVIDFWFSGPDSGIYDAWNKALQHAKGEWIQFIGAGDELADEFVFEKVSKYLSTAFPTYELVYGSIDIISESNRVFIERIAIPWESMRKKWRGIRPVLPMHPEVFHHKSIFKRIDFPNYKIAGDCYVMVHSVLRKDPLFINILIDKMTHGGVSTSPDSANIIYEELKEISKEFSLPVPFKNRMLYFLKVKLKIFVLKYLGLRFLNIMADIVRLIYFKKRKWTVK
ncbi:glycosyltransferase [Marinomonas rhizomae]|uniref:glycosyltransferase family 2 protein n=1 Tax=Marinomonas rhizomae TaxID=491948 RepID=UPI0021058F33|nr:glycosyltransferase family 2 protein [Marinomonas rhizomae]UTW00188.1 glycosyltransferase [Marinomonas rhizomae]